jgi:hypothetical protein
MTPAVLKKYVEVWKIKIQRYLNRLNVQKSRVFIMNLLLSCSPILNFKFYLHFPPPPTPPTQALSIHHQWIRAISLRSCAEGEAILYILYIAE